MTVSKAAYMHQIFDASRALGDVVISSDAYFEIKGHEAMGILIKQFPWPTLTPGGEIVVPLPQGGERWQPQNVKTNQQGQVSFIETKQGHIAALFDTLLATNGARFAATVYEGMPESFTKKCDIFDCFVQLDNPDRDFENKGQLMMLSGTLFFHYFANQ